MYSTTRSCGECTKCCDGWLAGRVLGENMYPGKPCRFVASGIKCSIYQNRPEDPCKTYYCEWLINDEIPEWMKPSEINIIIDSSTDAEGNKFYYLTDADYSVDENTLKNVIDFFRKNNKTLVWQQNKKYNVIGKVK